MPKVRAEHVEGDALSRRAATVGEGKLRVGIVEAPVIQAEAIRSICGGRRVAHVLRARQRDAGRWRRPARAAASPRCAGVWAVGLPEGAAHAGRAAPPIVDRLDPVELALDAIELAAKLSAGTPVARPEPIKLREAFPIRFPVDWYSRVRTL